MAINIFDVDMPEIEKDNDVSLESQIKHALEAFQASLQYRGEASKRLKQYTNDEVVIYGIDKNTKEPVTISIKDEVDVTTILPISMHFTSTNIHRQLMPQRHVHQFHRYVTKITPEDLDEFISEIESLQYMLYDEKASDLEEDDQLINISIYPKLKDFIINYKNLGEYMEDNIHIAKEYVKEVIESTYNLIMNMNIKSIHKGNIDNPTIDYSKFSESQEVDYPHTNYHYKTLPVEKRITIE